MIVQWEKLSSSQSKYCSADYDACYDKAVFLILLGVSKATNTFPHFVFNAPALPSRLAETDIFSFTPFIPNIKKNNTFILNRPNATPIPCHLNPSHLQERNLNQIFKSHPLKLKHPLFMHTSRKSYSEAPLTHICRRITNPELVRATIFHRGPGSPSPGVVNCPTWWSLLFIFGFLCWSSYFPSQIQRNIVLGRTLLLSALPSKDIGPQICALIIRFFHFWSMLKVLTRSVLILFISLNRALLNNLQPKVGCWASAFHGCGI